MQSKKTSVMTTLNVWELKFGRSTPRSARRSPPVLISHGQEWQLADLPLNLPADLPPVLTSSGLEWQFHIATVTAYIARSTGRTTPPVLTPSGQEWQFHIATVTVHIGRSTGRSTPQH